jgi:hypothetical protein
MKKSLQYILAAVFVVAVLCCAAGLFVALDVGALVKSEIHNIFQGNANLNPDTDLVVVDDVFGREGYMDNQGNVVIWPRYQYVEQFSEGRAIARTGQKFGFINPEGRYIIKPDFDAAFSFNNGLAVAEANGKYGIIDSTGKYVIQPTFAFLWELEDGRFGFYNEGYTEEEKPKYGITDKYGNILYQPGEYTQAQAISDFSDGMAAVQDPETNCWGFIDEKGTLVIPYQFEDKYNHESLFDNPYLKFQDGLACVGIGENQSELIDKKGNVIVDSFPMYDMYYTEYYGAFGSEPTLIPDYNNQYGYCGEGLHWMEKTPGMLTFFDNKGNVKFTVKGNIAGKFSEGLCSIGTGIAHYEIYHQHGKYGYIDKTGKLVIDYQYQYVSEFVNGVASFNTNGGGGWGYIDKSGRLLWSPHSAKLLALKIAIGAIIFQLVLAFYVIRKNKAKKLRPVDSDSTIL